MLPNHEQSNSDTALRRSPNDRPSTSPTSSCRTAELALTRKTPTRCRCQQSPKTVYDQGSKKNNNRKQQLSQKQTTGSRHAGTDHSLDAAFLPSENICSLHCSSFFEGTHRPLSSSFWGLPSRILHMNHKKEILRGLWVTL